MKVPRVVVAAFLASIGLLGATDGLAGQSCVGHAMSVAEFNAVLAMAGRTEGVLNRMSGDYAVIARVGPDISAYGLKYTHLGIAERRAGTGYWRVIHQLNPCGTGISVLRRDGLAVFMSDDLYHHDVQLIGLSAEVSKGLSRTLATQHPAALHEPRYSMIAHPGPTARYQNSNQWILEVITQAILIGEGHVAPDRTQVQRRYRQDGFKGSIVKVRLLKRAGARLGAANTRFDDHRARDRVVGRFEVVTVKSIVVHLARVGALESHLETRSDYRHDRQPSPVTPYNDRVDMDR